MQSPCRVLPWRQYVLRYISSSSLTIVVPRMRSTKRGENHLANSPIAAVGNIEVDMHESLEMELLDVRTPYV